MKLLFKISSIVLIVVVTILSIFSFEQINKDKRLFSSFINKQAKILEYTIPAAITDPIKNEDYFYIDKYLGSLINKHEIINYISLERNGELIASIQKADTKNDKIKKFAFEIEEYGKHIAVLKFHLSTKENDEIIERKINDFLTIISIASLLLIISLLFVIKTILIKYIEKLKKHTELIGKGVYNKDLIINTNDEFKDLANSINHMSKNIYTSSQNSIKLTKELKKQKNELVIANKAKDTFLANMSHELKTPLNSITLISSVMKRNRNKTLDEKQVKNIEVINKCADDLLFLINDILDITNLEAGKLKLCMEKFNLKDVFNDLVSMFEPQASHNKIGFTYFFDEEIGVVFSDKKRLKQIISIFLSNALKFTKQGHIELKVIDSFSTIDISVKDDGIGIEESKLDNIFDRFKQVDDTTTRQFEGIGLGLSISKELAKLLKAKIEVKSEVDLGSTFILKLPKSIG